MHEPHLFEYAVIRLVPRVERGEYLNVGVVLYCKQPPFLQVAFSTDNRRLLALYPDIDLTEINIHLTAFERICQGHPDGGPIAALDLPSRFRWLTAKRSTMIQCSAVHPGFCANLPAQLDRLMQELVLA